MDEQDILGHLLGLAGNLETARLMGLIAGHDTAGLWTPLAPPRERQGCGLGAGGNSPPRPRICCPQDRAQGGAALLTGGYDEAAMRALGSSSPRPGCFKC